MKQCAFMHTLWSNRVKQCACILKNFSFRYKYTENAEITSVISHI